MIKFSRKDTEKARAAVRALQIAKEKDSGCNKPEVNAALTEMFRGKCYICENKDAISSYQIEHLIPHGGNLDLKYNWNNLFWSCAHCNNIKNDRYVPILDCSQENVDRMTAFRKEGYFGTKEKYVFDPLESSEAVNNTAALLYAAYYGNTPQKKIEAANIRKALRKDLSKFKNLVREFDEAEEYDKEDLKCAIRREVSDNAAFAAFKRWILWDNSERYKELIQFCGL